MPETKRTSRRLAAILAADVVGYSRLMGADETGTLAALKAHREGLFNPAVAAHGGRVVKLMGDGTLVEFASVVDAVNCAVAIQRAARPADANGKAIVLRIGVNLGDVIIDGDDIYGDGVNVAARLEPLAEPGGVCVAAVVNESIANRVDVAFRDAGEVAVKNIDRPIRVWKWHPRHEATAAPAPAKATVADAPAPPSVAVLPFDNMSGDPEQAYFSDGISEDIITDLSRIAGLVVIARNSSFAYKGKSFDIRTVGRELGVRSVLEGSIRRAGNRVRITAQLIDAGSGAHIWADRYDRDLTDIFAVQDEVTRRIVEALRVTLTRSEEAMLEAGTGTTSVEAHDLLLKARAIMLSQVTRPAIDEARALLERAVALDPGYAEAHAAIAMTDVVRFNNSWTDDAAATLRHAEESASRAVALDPTVPFGHKALCTAVGFGRDFERARQAIDQALELAPNDADALVTRGAVLIFGGDPAAGIPDIERGRRLDPAGTLNAMHLLGLGHLLLGNYETAAAYFRERILLVPETDFSRAFLAAALGHLGRGEEARRVWGEIETVNPDYSFARHRSRMPFVNPADGERIAEGLRKAGITA